MADGRDPHIEDEARAIAREVATADRAALEAQAKRRAFDPTAPGDDSADATLEPVEPTEDAPPAVTRFDNLSPEELRELLGSLCEMIASGRIVLRTEEDDIELEVARSIDVGLTARCHRHSPRTRLTLELTWSRQG